MLLAPAASPAEKSCQERLASSEVAFNVGSFYQKSIYLSIYYLTCQQSASHGNMRVVTRPLLALRVPLARAAASARFLHAPASPSLRPAPLFSARRLAPPLLAARRRSLCTPGSASAPELVTTCADTYAPEPPCGT